ncbi:MAG: hypothetical protein FJW40_18040 [Acidobacteria bacterium]|nr:hypothetical protein [Acidobacteriota bacterium]
MRTVVLSSFAAVSLMAADFDFKKLPADTEIEYWQRSGLEGEIPKAAPALTIFLSTEVTFRNTNKTAAKRFFLCVTGVSKEGRAKVERFAYDIAYDNAAGRFDCKLTGNELPEEKTRLGNFGCQLVELKAGETKTMKWVTGAVPNNTDGERETPGKIRIQNGSTAGKRATGPAMAAHRPLGMGGVAPDDRLFSKTDKLLFQFVLLDDRKGMTAITKDGERNDKACNKCFGMNIFLKPPAAADLPVGTRMWADWHGHRTVRARPETEVKVPINLFTDMSLGSRTPRGGLKITVELEPLDAHLMRQGWQVTVDPGNANLMQANELRGMLTAKVPKGFGTSAKPEENLAQFVVNIKDGATLLTRNIIKMRAPAQCDTALTGIIDSKNILEIFALAGTRIGTPSLDDPYDVDRDGIITVNDARTCVQRCTYPVCASAQF